MEYISCSSRSPNPHRIQEWRFSYVKYDYHPESQKYGVPKDGIPNFWIKKMLIFGIPSFRDFGGLLHGIPNAESVINLFI